MMQQPPIAFFDFDGTITRHDTFITFGCHALGKVRLWLCVAIASPWLVLWKLGAISNTQAKRKLFSLMFKGMPRQKFTDLGHSFATVVEKDLCPKTMRLIEMHQQQGHKVVIVSASIGTWIRPWAESRAIDQVLSTEAEYNSNDLLTGRFSTLNCHGPEKVRRIQQAFPEVTEVDTYAYGDSVGDHEMFSFCKFATKIK
ncbi:HAD-IB family hydrolase [uncultured Duncaniella sp.]|uniref:HAD-IB family hydrolase n=2 Tax=uncultured Duncaniella sp. TaxID=2768039 RepID=UPI00341B7B3F